MTTNNANSCSRKLHRRRAAALAAAVIVAVAVVFLLLPRRRPRPDVLLITIDTLRPDHLGCYGAVAAHTPVIDGLAASGVRFRQAAAVAPITLPSHASILTGLLPPAHGLRDNGVDALGTGAVTLAERLQRVGYDTAAFVSAIVLNRRYGLDQGFARYDDDLWAENSPELFMIRERPGERTVARAISWLQGRAADSRPYFMWLHLFDPHQPLTPPEWARGISASPYDAEIAAVDRALGNLFAYLRREGRLERTLVVFTADHGESLGEHNEKTHAVFVYDATVRVPLIFSWPGRLPAGRVSDVPAHGVDIVPTMLGLLGLPGGKETQGVDLLPLSRRSGVVERGQYLESRVSELGFGMAPLYGMRRGGWKYIRAPRPELYDLRADPHELHNLYAARRDTAARLQAELERTMASCRGFAVKAVSGAMDRETEEALRSLGYLAGGGERQAMAGMDPKDGIGIYTKLEDARHLAQKKKWERAQLLLEEILNVLPRHVAARNILGLTLLRQGRVDEAVAQYRRSLADDPTQARVYAMLGNICMRRGEWREAEAMSREALRLTPGMVEAMSNLGLLAALQGRADEARTWYERALAADPGFPQVLRRLGDWYYEQGDFARALEHYRRVLAAHDTDFQAWIQAGNCRRRLGQPVEAEECFRHAQGLRPDSWVPAYNLACLFFVHGRVTEAWAALQRAVDNGLDNPDWLQGDPDLASARRMPAFPALLAVVKRRAAGG